jgi:hypothetical protein
LEQATAKGFRSPAAEGLHYRVATEATELPAQITGRSRNTAAQRSDLPGVGDFVAVRIAMGEGPAMIEAVLCQGLAFWSARRQANVARSCSGRYRCRLHRDGAGLRL